MLWAQARLAWRLRRAGVPPPPAPYTVDAWCEAIAQGRGRPIRIRGERLGADAPPGLLVQLDEADYVIIDAALPPLTRAQTVLHELAHLVLDHDGDALHADVDPAVEAEAEMAADLLYRQLARAASSTEQPSEHDGLLPAPVRPAWTPSAWWTDRRADWHLNQLWMTLRRGIPDAPLISTTTADQVPVEVGGSRQRHRKVIEVHDALRLLRPWFYRQVHASAFRRAQRYRLDPASVSAVAEAAAVAVALRRRQAAAPATDDAPHLLQRSISPYDVRAEARRLARMSRALHDSPLVTAEIARWGAVVTDSLPDSAGIRNTHLDGLPLTPTRDFPAQIASSAGTVSQ